MVIIFTLLNSFILKLVYENISTFLISFILITIGIILFKINNLLYEKSNKSRTCKARFNTSRIS